MRKNEIKAWAVVANYQIARVWSYTDVRDHATKRYKPIPRQSLRKMLSVGMGEVCHQVTDITGAKLDWCLVRVY